jgi:hypothetical protein
VTHGDFLGLTIVEKSRDIMGFGHEDMAKVVENESHLNYIKKIEYK